MGYGQHELLRAISKANFMSDQSPHRARIEPPKREIHPDFWRGALAGLMGGIAGSAAKLLVEQIIPPREELKAAPPELLAEKVAGHPLLKTEREVAKRAIHWSFGPLIGAAYGAAVEFEPELTARHGAAFGLGLNGLGHRHLLPILGISPPVEEQPRRERFSEVASLLVYGVVTETVRKMIRGR
jgi:putative membrane protein